VTKLGFRTDVDASRLDAYSEDIHRAAGLVESKKPVRFCSRDLNTF